jgi:hypothetical protein
LNPTAIVRPSTRVIYFFRRGAQAKQCETRLDSTGEGFELVVTDDGQERIEKFDTIGDMLAREHELLQAWRAQGWMDIGPSKSSRTSSDWEF